MATSYGNFLDCIFGKYAQLLCLIKMDYDNPFEPNGHDLLDKTLHKFWLCIYDASSLFIHNKIRISGKDINPAYVDAMKFIMMTYDTQEELNEIMRHSMKYENGTTYTFVSDLPGHMQVEIECRVKRLLIDIVSRDGCLKLCRDIFSDVLFSVDSIEEFNILLDLHGKDDTHDE